MSSLPSVLWALGWTLLHFVWQASLVALILALSRLSVRESSAESRYRLACAALFTLAALPLCTFGLIWGGGRAPEVGAPLMATLMSEGLAAKGGSQSWIATALPWVLASWGCGVGLLATRASFGWMQLRRLVRHRTEELSSDWRQRTAALCARMGIRERVRLITTTELSSPIVTGCWRPVVLVPLSVFSGLPTEQIESLILHELQHIKRHDLWVHRLQLVLETLFFYHPATWWISRVVHDEREFCCDAAVVEMTGNRMAYARALSHVAGVRALNPQPSLSSTGGPLMSRIRSIVQPSPSARPSRLATTAWSMAAVGLLVALIATTSAIGDATHDFSPQWMPESVERWNDELQRAARAHDIDPALLSIMTLLESRGKPQVVSSRGAMGLMQIMPATALKIAEVRGIKNFDVEALRDPATNLDFGAWYLARQLTNFGDGKLSEVSVERAAAAYNGGPKRLRRHLEHGEPLSEETQRYSGLVRKLWNERSHKNSETLARLLGTEM